MNNKIVVYTCITQDYDNLLEPVFVDKEVDYICFTDNSELLKQNYTKNTWKILDIPSDILSITEDKLKQQRLVKILAHKVLPEDYSLSVYIDANIRITFYITDFLKKYLYSRRNNDFILIRKHPTRNCIYDEQKEVIRLGKDTFENTRQQMMKYIQEGYPAQYGLTENNILVRCHQDKRCIDLMNCWADEVIQYSYRDQLSFNYALWKTGLKNHGVRIIDMPIHNSKWFRYFKHKCMMTEDSVDDNPSDDSQEDFNFIVAFSTHQKRFLRLVETDCKSLETILNQKTDYKYKVVLTLYKEDYDSLPEKLKEFIEKNNIEVIVAEQNLKVHLKWYYAVQKYGDKYPVILVDDDVYYQNFLFDMLYKSHLKHDNCIVASRCHLIETDSENIVLPYSVWKKYEIIKKFNMTFDERKLFATGVGGVLYPPKSIDFNLIKIDEMMSLAGTNDDIYLKYITSKSGVRTVMLPLGRN